MKNIVFILICCFLISCGSHTSQKKESGQELQECQGKFETHKLILKWDKNNEVNEYDLKLSNWPLNTNAVCGSWKYEKWQNLEVYVITNEPLTFVLQLPITDNSWWLEATKINDQTISGTFIHETWGTTRKVGAFEVWRN